jgi:putative ABC transport system permease protein
VVKGRMETLGQFKQFSYFISAIIVAVGGLVVLVTLMGSVRERTEEIGIFRAIGFRKGHVMSIIFLEAGILSVVAGVLGYAAGLGGTRIAFRLLVETHSIGVPINPTLAGAAIAMAVTVGLLASAYPALMAARMDPNQALKSL